MKREEFKKILKEKILVLDGATGTELQKRGMPTDTCPELWAAEHPELLTDVQQEYVKAGSDVVYTFTLCGTRTKLEEYGLGERTVEINSTLAGISRKAVGKGVFVAGILSTTGNFVQPFGDMDFEHAVDIYREQAQGLVDGGVDFFVIETMIDIQEARAALIAVKETCSLPVCVSMTFNDDARTLTGTDPTTALVTLQSLGADAVGCNCSTGPAEMTGVIASMKADARVPLIAKPNAGLPVLRDGKTFFNMDPDEFAGYMDSFIERGVNLVGGCCGTTPGFIRRIKQKTSGVRPVEYQPEKTGVLTSARKTVFLGMGRPVTIIGERINPTGKKELQKALKNGEMQEVKRIALEQADSGAAVLDINAGMPGIDEKETLLKMVEAVSVDLDTPLCIDSSDPEAIEKALRIYPGRALVNSVSGESEKLQKVLPAAAKYGAMFILLPLDDEGVPESAEARCSIIERVYEKALDYGYTRKDILADGLAMTVSSEQDAAVKALEVIDWCSSVFRCGTVVGLSNISYGLPQRKWINAAFLAMAVAKGLTCAIANPMSELTEGIRMASDVLTGADKGSISYIERFSREKETVGVIKKPEGTPESIYNCVVKGNTDEIAGLLQKALKEGEDAGSIVDERLIPAITHVGELFDSRKYYLPQLIRSAETAKKAFEYLKPMLEESNEGYKKRTLVVLATVKGDIHDIGKNIVGLMLKNHGFEVLDLGKDVDAARIVDRAKETGAGIIGLSALMTTTMVEMKEVIDLARKQSLKCRFMIGGAVVNSSYAQEIGADGYAADAHRAVRLAEELSS